MLAVEWDDFPTGGAMGSRSGTRNLPLTAWDFASHGVTVGEPWLVTSAGLPSWAPVPPTAGSLAEILAVTGWHQVICSMFNLAPVASPIAVSDYFRALESTYKGVISFRLGMAGASVAGSELLKAPLSFHLSTLRAAGLVRFRSKKRPDLICWNPVSNIFDVIEAKGWTASAPPAKPLIRAKSQARAVRGIGVAGATLRHHVVAATLAGATSGDDCKLLLLDPEVDEGDPEMEPLDPSVLLYLHYRRVAGLIRAVDERQIRAVRDDVILGDDVLSEVLHVVLPGIDLAIVPAVETALRATLLSDSYDARSLHESMYLALEDWGATLERWEESRPSSVDFEQRRLASYGRNGLIFSGPLVNAR